MNASLVHSDVSATATYYIHDTCLIFSKPTPAGQYRIKDLNCSKFLVRFEAFKPSKGFDKIKKDYKYYYNDILNSEEGEPEDAIHFPIFICKLRHIFLINNINSPENSRRVLSNVR